MLSFEPSYWRVCYVGKLAEMFCLNFTFCTFSYQSHHNKQADIKVSLVKCHLSIANIHFQLCLPTSWRDSFTHLLAALSLIKPSQLFAFSGRGFMEGSV